MSNWSTKEHDMHIAKIFMEEYARAHEVDQIGLFEIVVDQTQKSMNVRLSSWVLELALHFKRLYGADQGDAVTRQVISNCFIQGQTIH